MKERTKKNILFVMLCLTTLGILIFIYRLNENRLYNLSKESSIKKYLAEINYDGLSNKIVEDPSSIVFVTDSNDSSSIEFEKIFIPVIKKYNLENQVVFINIKDKLLVDPIYQKAPQLIFYSKSNVFDIMDCSLIKNQISLINEFKQRGVIND